MAETKTRKPSAAQTAKGKTTAPKSRAAKGTKSATVTTTAASTKPATKSKTKSKPAASRKSAATSPSKTKNTAKNAKRERDSAQVEARIRRRSLFVEQFLPYILVAVGLFLLACFITDATGEATTPAEHRMGAVGFYVCKLLFGCFGWAAYLIPPLLVNLVIFWKHYCEDGLVPVKVILSVLVTVFLAGVGHVFLCNADPAMAEVYDVGHLYRTGYEFESGGVLGGLLGYALYLGLKLPGTIVLAVLALPLLLMCLVGVTPAYVFGKLWNWIKAKWQASAEERALRRDEEAAEAEAAHKAATAEGYRARREKRDETGTEAPAPVPAPAVAPAAASTGEASGSGKRFARVDTYTGEMMEDPDQLTVEDAPAPEETAPSLPFFEPAAKADKKEETDTVEAPSAPEDSTEEDGNFKPATFGKPIATRSLPDDRRIKAPEEIESMEVDFDDEPDETYGDESYEDPDMDPDEDPDEDPDDEDAEEDNTPRKPTVDYEVYTAAEEAPAVSDKPVTTVRILKSDSSALPEAGLSEEETYCPPDPEELPPEEEPSREYLFPPVEMLTRGPSRYETNDEEIAANTQLLREVLESFHIRVKEINCSCGPTITRFEVKPESGIRVRSIANLVDDISMNLAKAGVRIEAPIPGKAAVGIEVPNAEPATVYFRNILETPEFRNHKSRLAACLGADVSGRPVIMDINKMPHLLVAGTTGSGKSVCINSIIMSILYKAKPDEVKLILIDPKKVEFAVFRDLPHLYCPLISDPNKAAGALNSAVNEMERRFGLIEEVGVRNIASYNEITAGDPARPPLPRMVIVIDELADLMMTASNDVETAICRLAQKGRAAGMHLILGTQRPSTDVITGLIKANVPSRIAFTVKQQIDSRIIIDAVGAEKLIGRGDMLYAPVGETKPLRVQGAFVSDSEVERVVTFIREHNERGEFDENFTRDIEIETAKCLMSGKKKGEQVSIDDFAGLEGVGGHSREDAALWQAMEIIVDQPRIGTSALQRRLSLGYGRAAKIVDRLEAMGFIGPDDGKKQGRLVYLTRKQLAEYKMNGLPDERVSAPVDDGDEDDE